MTTITLTTDFGAGSPYAAAMKGVILSIHPGATIVDVTHNVPPQDIRYAAIVLEDVSNWFPPDTIHVVVVDPGVGTDRAIVFARIGRQNYIAPDNGLLSRLTRRICPEPVIRLTESKYWLQPVSATFHGRDIMAPVAARLSMGLDPKCLGVASKRLVSLEWPPVHVASRRMEGSVIWIDSFGNLMTDITADMLTSNRGEGEVEVTCLDCKIGQISRTYGEHEHGSAVALIGSNGRLEIAVVGGNAAQTIDARIGSPVVVRWPDR
jgi:S-adenosylmethionine hydrolase